MPTRSLSKSAHVSGKDTSGRGVNWQQLEDSVSGSNTSTSGNIAGAVADVDAPPRTALPPPLHMSDAEFGQAVKLVRSKLYPSCSSSSTSG